MVASRNCSPSASCAAIAPILGGLCADFFAAHELTVGFTWKSELHAVKVQVLDFHDWTFFFAIAFLVGLFSLHRLSFVQEASGSADPLLVRDLLLEARRAVRGMSSVAGLVRIGRVPAWLMRPRPVRMRMERMPDL